MLDTGAEKSIISLAFVKQHDLIQKYTKLVNLILAVYYKIKVNKVIDTISINLGSMNIKTSGLVCPSLTIDIISGIRRLYCFQPIIDWEMSNLTIKRKGINFHIYQDGIDHLLKDYVFFKLAEIVESGNKVDNFKITNSITFSS